MKSIFLPMALVASTLCGQDLPVPSPRGEVEQVIGLTEVEVDYSRPSMRGRRIFGDLVKFDELWRTGANQNTTIEFSGPVVFGGEPIEKGKYSLFTVPGDKVWVVKLNSNTDMWGEDEFKEEEVVLAVKVPAGPNSEVVETLTFEFANLGEDRADLVLSWEKTKVVIPIVADATEQALANIKEAIEKGEMKFSGYNGCANFALDRNVMIEEALSWATKSVEMDKRYWNTHTLARAMAANGDMKGAIAMAEMSMSIAQEAKSEAYVKKNRDRIEEWSKGVK